MNGSTHKDFLLNSITQVGTRELLNALQQREQDNLQKQQIAGLLKLMGVTGPNNDASSPFSAGFDKSPNVKLALETLPETRPGSLTIEQSKNKEIAKAAALREFLNLQDAAKTYNKQTLGSQSIGSEISVATNPLASAVSALIAQSMAAQGSLFLNSPLSMIKNQSLTVGATVSNTNGKLLGQGSNVEFRRKIPFPLGAQLNFTKEQNQFKTPTYFGKSKDKKQYKSQKKSQLSSASHASGISRTKKTAKHIIKKARKLRMSGSLTASSSAKLHRFPLPLVKASLKPKSFKLTAFKQQWNNLKDDKFRKELFLRKLHQGHLIPQKCQKQSF